MANETDYEFPIDWEDMSDEEKCQWFFEQRAKRQAARQKTETGRRIRDNVF